ncbi:hypothetical protein AB0K60_06310 [Thermopolyspora sp. NPDC052614]|uniref:hypothetical protein n=1 Tax=Thermopolyspora sp. NPDC052614 TaxID=3155682 RepID=UPI0034155EB1
MNVALVRFKVAAYARSHLILQPFLALLVLLILLYSTRVPAGDELAAYTDSAIFLTIVCGWTARSLLNCEPDTQRLISMTSAGRPHREVVAGVVAAVVVNLGLAAPAIAVPLAIGFAAMPGGGVIGVAAVLHLLGVSAGTALGALTSRPLLPSPATSLLTLVGGYVTMIVLSLTPLAWASAVPAVVWMRAVNDGDLVARLPLFAAHTLAWSGVALAAYLWLRRTRC